MGERCSPYTDILNNCNNSVVLPSTRPAQKTLSWRDPFFPQKSASVPGKSVSCPLHLLQILEIQNDCSQ